MTQTVKDEIRQSLLAAAREEFIRNGFEKASIRTITANAKTAKSNVYNYFADKDALFAAVLEPVTREIRRAIEQARTENAGKSTESYTWNAQEIYMRGVMKFVAAHPAEIGLLLYGAGGTSLAGFKDEALDAFTTLMSEWMEAVTPGHVPSRLFMRCVSGFYLSVVEQMLAQKPTPAQAKAYMQEFLQFIYCGWRGMMDGTQLSEKA